VPCFPSFHASPLLFSPRLRWKYRKVSPSARENARVIFEPELETLPTERLHALQVERLRALIARVKERVPIYGDRLADVEPGDIASLDDLRRLPFTRKDDLRDTYPFGMFAVPPEEIVRIHASSGTTGKLTVVGYTAADVDRKSTRLNSSHGSISYAVFCLKKKKEINVIQRKNCQGRPLQPQIAYKEGVECPQPGELPSVLSQPENNVQKRRLNTEVHTATD